MITTLPSYEEVLGFWFGEPGSKEHLQPNAKWFQPTDTFDEEIRQRFGALHAALRNGKLPDWYTSPRSLLATIIVLDQFSRNLCRNSSQAFENDEAALNLARHAIAKGWDKKLAPMERSFLYMPFMHAENLSAQEEGLIHFATLPSQEFQEALHYMKRHHRVIQRFGRFPHRNQVLGRPNTPEESSFLASPFAPF